MFQIRTLLLSLLTLFAFNFCNGQMNGGMVQQTCDSLEWVKPLAYKRFKPQVRAYTIAVGNQQQFDAMNDEISKAVKAGEKNIKVKIRRGVYQFRREHICRKNEQTDVSISFIGDNAIITADKNYASTEGKGSGWQGMRYADSIIHVVDDKKKLCMVPFANNLSETVRKGMSKVQITQWFRSKTYIIERVDRNGIYFIAPELAWENGYGDKGYNVNFDYLYLGKIPRFRVYDASKEPNCAAGRFLSMENCSYYSLNFKGIEFRSTDASNILLHFTNVEAKQIAISDCKFDYIRGNGVGFFKGTSNVLFDSNEVCNTGGDELFFSDNCQNIQITNNTFKNCGQSLGNFFCVRCYDADYYIANNTFCDFGYAAIGVGVWHGFEKKYYSGGIIENNDIYFTPEYFANAWKHMLMDSGAIYVWTQNDNVIIRYNYIHDYTGAGDNRGIFCDDGANNLKIYRNVIVNTPNSYSIDSRACKDQREGFLNNANNLIAQNVVDGRVRFQGHANLHRHVVKGANYVLTPRKEKVAIQNKFENLEVMEEDEEVQNIQDVLKLKEFKKFKLKIKG